MAEEVGEKKMTEEVCGEQKMAEEVGEKKMAEEVCGKQKMAEEVGEKQMAEEVCGEKKMAEEVRGEGKKKVMVAIDESEFSAYALEWVINNMSDSITTSSPLLIFTAQPLTDVGYVYAASYGVAVLNTAPELINSVQEYQKKIKTALLRKAKDLCAKHGIVAETISEVGNPKEAICDAAEKFKVSLLVVGNHGKGAIKRVFLGSVSNYCVHHAKCPVLVVKKPITH